VPTKNKSSVSPTLCVRSAPVDPLTLSYELAEREFGLNPEYLKVKLLMLATAYLVAHRESELDLDEATIDYLVRGFELIGLKTVSAALDHGYGDTAAIFNQALFSLSADAGLDKYKLPELPRPAVIQAIAMPRVVVPCCN
jgi:hypothetical protein